MSLSLLVLLCLLVVLAVGCQAAAPGGPGALVSVWAVDDGEKILRDNLTSPLKTGEGSSVWDGKGVRLFSARNETVALQLILQAGGEGARAVDVRVSDLVSGASRIRGSHPLPKPDDYRGVGVELFTEHYLHVTTPSYNDPEGGGFDWTAAANPKLTGWIPDALIPFSAKRGLGGAPFDIGANLNQGVWVDVYVPKGAAPGAYTGTITVSVDGKTTHALPVHLEVLDLTLPDELHYHSMIYYSSGNIASRHDTRTRKAHDQMILNYHRMAHRHRLELTGEGELENVPSLSGTLDGSAFTPAQGYEGPGQGVGNTFFSVNTYGCTFESSEEGYRRGSDQAVAVMEKFGPKLEYFLYITDEPEPDRYAWIQKRAEWIKKNPGPGKKLPIFTTKWPAKPLQGSIDIWCSHTENANREQMEQALKRGERYWLYAAYRPRSPGDTLDEYGVAFRIKPWIAHQHGIARWFTWESTHWYPNRNEKPNDRPKDIWNDPVIFTSGPAFTTGNGDGTFFYPGQDHVQPDEDRGYPGPLSSIRMKMYRRGAQDVEYLWLAEQAGHKAEVEALVKKLLPATLWDADMSGPPTWSNRNADYERARRELAGLAMGKR